MITVLRNTDHKYFYKLTCLFLILVFQKSLSAQGFSEIQQLSAITAYATSGEKPQSKVWFYEDYWWAVIPVPESGPDPPGTYIWRLDGTEWIKITPSINSATNFQADIISVGNLVHIILKTVVALQNQTLKFYTLEFVTGAPPSYQLWSGRSPNEVAIPLESYAKTATIDIDSEQRLWIASDGGGVIQTASKQVYVKWSGSPYETWSAKIELQPTLINSDDITAILSFGGNKMGVMWSDQNAREFRFRYRNDGDSPEDPWSDLEIVASGSSPGLGIADDHINFANHSDGTIYAAIKTGYDFQDSTRLGLLVRRPSGNWDPLYRVTKSTSGGLSSEEGTRPIVLLNETDGILTFCYPHKNPGGVGGYMRYRESPIDVISFSDDYYYLTFNSLWNSDPTSTKQTISNEVVIMFSQPSSPFNWRSVKIKRSQLDTNHGAGYAFNFSDPTITDNKAIAVSDLNPSLIITGPITIEAWINPEDRKDQSILNRRVIESSIVTNAYDLSLSESGNIVFTINDFSPLVSTTIHELGKWEHIAAVYDLSEMKIYINGILNTSGSASGNINELRNTQVIIGARKKSNSTINNPQEFENGFDGFIDELRLWNSARTEDEIRESMSKKLTGNETSLQGYWRFDNPAGLTVPDYSGNDNYGSIFNLTDFRYDWSGAAIGESSAYIYATADEINQTISHDDGDSFTSYLSVPETGLIGLQLYRIDSPAFRQSSAGLPADFLPYAYIDSLRYWGVKVIGVDDFTLNVEYNFSNRAGIFDPLQLDLVYKSDGSEIVWEEVFAELNASENILYKTVENKAGEFALAFDTNPPSVELSSFTGRLVNNSVKLSWRTETETMNLGFDVEKSIDGIAFNKIAFVQGYGNSNSPKNYSYSDPLEVGASGSFYYRLKQIDIDGTFDYSSIVTVEIRIPSVYELFQNYPNPFNPNTNITFQIPEKSRVTLKVFNSIGEEVAEVMNEEKEAGYYEVNFNANNLASGVYIYTLISNEYLSSKKMLLIK